MPLTLISTPGAADANTYADLAYYKGYIESRLPQPSWAITAISGTTIDEDLKRDLIAATKILDMAFDWTGEATTDTQSLSWPRTGMLSKNKFEIPNATIPVELKNAQSELSVQLHDNDLVTDNIAIRMGLKRLKAGSIELGWQESDLSTAQGVDAMIQRLGSDLHYLSESIPRMVRLLLVPSWYREVETGVEFMFEPLVAI